ncbi:MAG: acetyl-CoA carboxylase biotin carboxyl carrier protein subunit [Planctomycetota bacterium]
MRLRITVEGKAYDVEVEVLDGAPVAAPLPAASAPAAPIGSAAPSAPPPPKPAAAPSAGGGDGEVRSPVAGTVLSITVKPGDEVGLNDTLLVLEAMKMESAVASPSAGKIAEVLVSTGDTVAAGQVLVRLG